MDAVPRRQPGDAHRRRLARGDAVRELDHRRGGHQGRRRPHAIAYRAQALPGHQYRAAVGPAGRLASENAGQRPVRGHATGRGVTVDRVYTRVLKLDQDLVGTGLAIEHELLHNQRRAVRVKAGGGDRARVGAHQARLSRPAVSKPPTGTITVVIVTGREQATAAVADTVSELGRLDTVINNAGVMLLAAAGLRGVR